MAKTIKCPNCGASIKGNAKSCEFCGTQFSAEVLKENEKANKAGCPKCGSTNVTFSREKQREITAGKNTVAIRSTVGVCKDCGYTWDASAGAQQPKEKKRTWLWVLGWLFIFPVPLTILLLRPTTQMDSKARCGIIVAAWVLYVLIIGGSAANNKNADQPPQTAIETQTELATE